VLTDVIFILLLIAFVLHGLFKGFLRGVLSLVTVFLSIIISVLLAWPLALLFDSWFDWVENHGLAVVIIITAIVIFIIIRLAIFLLMRFVAKLKERSRVLNWLDMILGLLLGLFRFTLYFASLAAIISLAANIPPLARIPEWLFDESVIASWFYQLVLRLLPF